MKLSKKEKEMLKDLVFYKLQQLEKIYPKTYKEGLKDDIGEQIKIYSSMFIKVI